MEDIKQNLYYTIIEDNGLPVKIRLVTSSEKHKRLKDYGNCDIYIHLRTDEEKINHIVYDCLKEASIFFQKAKKRNRANRDFKIFAEIKGDFGTVDLYFRRAHSTEDLPINFIISVLERTLDYLEDDLGVLEELESKLNDYNQQAFDTSNDEESDDWAFNTSNEFDDNAFKDVDNDIYVGQKEHGVQIDDNESEVNDEWNDWDNVDNNNDLLVQQKNIKQEESEVFEDDNISLDDDPFKDILPNSLGQEEESVINNEEDNADDDYIQRYLAEIQQSNLNQNQLNNNETNELEEGFKENDNLDQFSSIGSEINGFGENEKIEEISEEEHNKSSSHTNEDDMNASTSNIEDLINQNYINNSNKKDTEKTNEFNKANLNLEGLEQANVVLDTLEDIEIPQIDPDSVEISSNSFKPTVEQIEVEQVEQKVEDNNVAKEEKKEIKEQEKPNVKIDVKETLSNVVKNNEKKTTQIVDGEYEDFFNVLNDK